MEPKTVIVVDDDELSRVMLGDLLRSLGCKAVSCGSAADALATVAGGVPAALGVSGITCHVLPTGG